MRKGLNQYEEAKYFLLDYVRRNYDFEENEIQAYQKGMIDAFEYLVGRLKSHGR
ncbi:hypothetical protein [Halobacillus litoralis]|uniref:hypothetical protein n=1 Tax=Halobacillus litoralis TaxID=45668 RepID=UPI001CD728A1|nr:hypothetical protein [Halobacillus litoralis]MCA1021521.1 hypothetical protein [Halobacillus litoralis]